MTLFSMLFYEIRVQLCFNVSIVWSLQIIEMLNEIIPLKKCYLTFYLNFVLVVSLSVFS